MWKTEADRHVVVERFQTERDGQDEDPERLRGEADRVGLVQHGEGAQNGPGPGTVGPWCYH